MATVTGADGVTIGETCCGGLCDSGGKPSDDLSGNMGPSPPLRTWARNAVSRAGRGGGAGLTLGPRPSGSASAPMMLVEAACWLMVLVVDFLVCASWERSEAVVGCWFHRQIYPRPPNPKKSSNKRSFGELNMWAGGLKF